MGLGCQGLQSPNVSTFSSCPFLHEKMGYPQAAGQYIWDLSNNSHNSNNRIMVTIVILVITVITVIIVVMVVTVSALLQHLAAQALWGRQPHRALPAAPMSTPKSRTHVLGSSRTVRSFHELQEGILISILSR